MTRRIFAGGVNDIFVARIAETRAARLAHVCAWCHQPRSQDDAVWVRDRATISHGICPTCEAKHFGGAA